ncbi:unnamed protein product [Vitrella brassicaformis CCMP3155]|uniref:RRM domain-containing protein n=1 Tax=Vitrella brassicaformis (strain CCMP3155) TaxID=1169540 RepID=A0A0G4GEG7_VITBC|nr:unnamed protein product [Vitrella brassicaformis CCMP3155]|eukprot:CEM27531.1 unnamed protein product [Vitrella brassicaformis CCMP3155]
MSGSGAMQADIGEDQPPRDATDADYDPAAGAGAGSASHEPPPPQRKRRRFDEVAPRTDGEEVVVDGENEDAADAQQERGVKRRRGDNDESSAANGACEPPPASGATGPSEADAQGVPPPPVDANASSTTMILPPLPEQPVMILPPLPTPMPQQPITNGIKTEENDAVKAEPPVIKREVTDEETQKAAMEAMDAAASAFPPVKSEDIKIKEEEEGGEGLGEEDEKEPGGAAAGPPAPSEEAQRTIVVSNIAPSTLSSSVLQFFAGGLSVLTGREVTQMMAQLKLQRYDVMERVAVLECPDIETANIACQRLNGIKMGEFTLNIQTKADVERQQFERAAEAEMQALMAAEGMLPEGASPASAEPAGPPDYRLLVQNLPMETTDAAVRDIVGQFGKIKTFELLRDPGTGTSKGIAVFEYEDEGVTDVALQALNGMVCLGRNLIARKASQGVLPIAPQIVVRSDPNMPVTALPSSVTHRVFSNPIVGTQVKAGRRRGGQPTKVVQLLNCVYQEDLMNDTEFEALEKEIREEAAKHGALVDVVIPRPPPDLSYKEGVGKVFLSYADETSSRRAQMMLNGRKFDQKHVVCAAFYPEDKFNEGKYTLL